MICLNLCFKWVVLVGMDWNGLEVQHGDQETLGRLLELLKRGHEQRDNRIGKRGNIQGRNNRIWQSYRADKSSHCFCAIAQQVSIEDQLWAMHSAKHC